MWNVESPLLSDHMERILFQPAIFDEDIVNWCFA